MRHLVKGKYPHYRQRKRVFKFFAARFEWFSIQTGALSMAVSMIYGIPEKCLSSSIVRVVFRSTYIVLKYFTIYVVLSTGVKGLTKWAYLSNVFNLQYLSLSFSSTGLW